MGRMGDEQMVSATLFEWMVCGWKVEDLHNIVSLGKVLGRKFWECPDNFLGILRDGGTQDIFAGVFKQEEKSLLPVFPLRIRELKVLQNLLMHKLVIEAQLCFGLLPARKHNMVMRICFFIESSHSETSLSLLPEQLALHKGCVISICWDGKRVSGFLVFYLYIFCQLKVVTVKLP